MPHHPCNRGGSADLSTPSRKSLTQPVLFHPCRTEPEEDQQAEAERNELRNERKRERERERRLENKDGKRSKMTRDSERDVSERIALGQAVPNSSETLYDQRLFNQTSGLSSGLGGADDAYNIYDKVPPTLT